MSFWRVLLVIMVLFIYPAKQAGADEGASAEKRYFDLRLSAGIGVFYYPQLVDGGYYINDEPYDLTWYGFQPQLTGEVQYFLPWVPQLGLGVGGAYFIAVRPSAMDKDMDVSVDLGANAHGGYYGISGSYWFSERFRIDTLIGYGGTGKGKYYGGHGFSFSVGASYLYSSGGIIGGIGGRFLFMGLNHSGDEDTRGEHGPYFALLLEASVDWAPRF